MKVTKAVQVAVTHGIGPLPLPGDIVVMCDKNGNPTENFTRVSLPLSFKSDPLRWLVTTELGEDHIITHYPPFDTDLIHGWIMYTPPIGE